jgi:hypothetical protein
MAVFQAKKAAELATFIHFQPAARQLLTFSVLPPQIPSAA